MVGYITEIGFTITRNTIMLLMVVNQQLSKQQSCSLTKSVLKTNNFTPVWQFCGVFEYEMKNEV